MNIRLLISIIESTYLIYMFNFFKTYIDFNVFASPTNYWFKHLIGNEYGIRICLFGQILSVPGAILLITRNFYKILNKYTRYGIYASMGLSLMNINAIVYLLPIWILELFILPNIKF